MFLLFSVLLRIQALELPDREEHQHIILMWGRLGEITLGGIKETGKSGRQIYREVNHEILLHIITTQQGTFLQGLSYLSSISLSQPLSVFRDIYILYGRRTKTWIRGNK